MSLSSVENVYLAPSRRRPSFDQFVETALQTPADGRVVHIQDDNFVPPIDDNMPSMLDAHLDELDPAPELESLDESFDRAKNAAHGTYRDMVPFTRSMQEIGASEDDPGKGYDSSEEDKLSVDAALPEPTNNMVRTRSGQRASSPAESSSEEEGVEVPKGKTLRARTLSQQYPYLHDKKKHALNKKQGQDARSSDVDAEVLRSTQPPKAKKSKSPLQTRKRMNIARRSGRGSKARKTSTESTVSLNRRSVSTTPASVASSTSSGKVEYTLEQIMEHTTLYTYLKGDPEGAAITMRLERCHSLDMLIAFAKDTWVNIKGGSFHSIECILHWKKDNKRILIREGMEYCFEEMVEEIKDAPAWKKGERKLQVKMMVTLV